MAKKEPRLIPHDPKDDLNDEELAIANGPLSGVAAVIVSNLNANKGIEKALGYMLPDEKDAEVARTLARFGIEKTDEVEEKLMDLIGYADPFITEADAKLAAAGKDMLEALKLADKIVQTARRYFPKSIRNSDTFMLNNYGVAISKAIHKAEVE